MSPELDEDGPKKFLCYMNLLIGVRSIGALNAFCFFLLLILAICKHGHSEAVWTQLFYAFFVFLPGVAAVALLELKGRTLLNRRVVMITAWYTVAATLFINIFIIGYVILYVDCQGEKKYKKDCKDSLFDKIGAVIILMVFESAVQVYLAMVATWYFLAFEKDNREIEDNEERRRSTREMKNALVGYQDNQVVNG